MTHLCVVVLHTPASQPPQLSVTPHWSSASTVLQALTLAHVKQHLCALLHAGRSAVGHGHVTPEQPFGNVPHWGA
jgi:hypothetical protein